MRIRSKSFVAVKPTHPGNPEGKNEQIDTQDPHIGSSDQKQRFGMKSLPLSSSLSLPLPLPLPPSLSLRLPVSPSLSPLSMTLITRSISSLYAQL